MWIMTVWFFLNPFIFLKNPFLALLHWLGLKTNFVSCTYHKGNALSLSLSMMFVLGFSWVLFIRLRKFPYISSLRFFCWILARFNCMYEISYDFSSLIIGYTNQLIFLKPKTKLNFQFANALFRTFAFIS